MTAEVIEEVVMTMTMIPKMTNKLPYEKKEVIGLAHEFGVDIGETISCYEPNGNVECGKCLSCLAKRDEKGN